VALQRALYSFAYRFGRRPRWDTGITPPELVALVEGPGALPPGRALDLGCGTGTNVVYLARHGWQATGVDFVTAAVARARRRARRGGVEARFVAGDVTRLEELGVEGPYDLVVDIGCFHGIPPHRRDAYARGVASLTQPGATLTMFAFASPSSPRRLRHWSGAPEAEVRARLGPFFEVAHVEQGRESRPGARMLPAWYRLVRR